MKRYNNFIVILIIFYRCKSIFKKKRNHYKKVKIPLTRHDSTIFYPLIDQIAVFPVSLFQ